VRSTVTKATLIAAACGIFLGLAAEALARPARCVLTGSTTYKGKCDFTPLTGNGGFSISPIGRKSFDDGIDPISVAKIAKDRAEVRGQTSLGINSRWGEATRSRTDPACWEGSDFKICVY
jgi:hypothetical protein